MPNSRILGALLTGLITVICAVRVSAGVNAWSYHGPVGGGGKATAVAVHPTNNSIVILGTVRGINRSTDGGSHWTLVKDDTFRPPTEIAFDPSAPNRIVATDGSSMYLSADTGLTFATLPVPATGVVAKIAFSQTGRLFVGFDNGRLFKATAPFANWTEITGSWAANSLPGAIAVDPSDPNVIYLGIGDSGLYRSDNEGTSWSAPLTNGFSTSLPILVHQIAVNPADPNWVVAATQQSTFVSTNRGASWGRTDYFSTFWVGFDPETPNAMAALRGYEVLRSNDNGLNWSVVMNPRANSASHASFVPGAAGRLLLANSAGFAITNYTTGSLVYGNDGLTGVEVRKLAASDDGTIYGAMTSGNADVFRRSGSGFLPLDGSQTLAATTLPRLFSTVAVFPGNSQQIFAVNNYVELIRTFDGGAHWTSASPAFLPTVADFTTDVEFDPGNAAVAYVARDPSGIWKTTDSGANFALLAGSPASAHAVAVSPHDSRVIYVAAGANNDAGIYKSIDGGTSWLEQLAPSASLRYFRSFSFHPSQPDTVYANSATNSYQTTDGGVTWTVIRFPNLGSSPVEGMYFDPLIPTTMVAISPGGPGFFRSVDGGTTWRFTSLTSTGPTSVNIFTGLVNPLNAEEVIVGTDTAGVAEYQVALDLALATDPIPATLPVGTTVSSRFTVTNNGPHDSSTSELRIDVPSWVTPTAPGCTRSGQTLRCPFGVTRKGEAHSVQVSFAVDAAAQGNGQINATLTGHETDTDRTNNIAGQAVAAAEIADVDVAVTASATSIDRGDSTSVTVTTSNAGPSASTATTLLVQLPANLSASNVAISVGSCTPAASAISCSFGTLAANGSATVSFALRGDSPGQGTVAAHAAGNGTDLDGAHDAARAITVRPVADMAVALAESADPVTVGAPFQYTATITNNSGDAAGFTVTIPISGASVSSASAGFGPCTVAGSTVTCTGLGLAAGANGSVTIDLLGATPGIATATATVNYAGTDQSTANNSANIGTTLRLVGDASVEIVDSSDPITVGSPLSYMVTAHNLGPNAGALRLTVALAGGSVSTVTPANGTCTSTASSVACDFPPAADGVALTANILVATTDAGTVTATAAVDFAGTDPVTSNNTASASTTVNAAPSPPPPSGGGNTGGGSGGGSSGGGGRFDWLALGLLGLLVASRGRLPGSARR